MTIHKAAFADAQNKKNAGLLFKCLVILLIVSFPKVLFAQIGSDGSDETLINQYVQSKNGVISFDASNIKQFWVSNYVVGINSNINISLTNKNNNSFESVPLKIQLANVRAEQDCKVDVITENSDFSFSIMDTNLNSLASSVMEEDFLRYHVYSSSFHLADVQQLAFNFIFKSKKHEQLSLKKIVLSFSANTLFHSSPGTIHFSKGNLFLKNCSVEENGNGSFFATGRYSALFSQNCFLVGDNPLELSVTVKNISNTPTTIYVGYVPYKASGEQIDCRSFPYKNNKVMKVVSSEVNSNKIIVDDYPEWTKGCFVALNAKEDLSDLPNCSYIDGSVVEVNKIDGVKVEIVFDKPLKNQIAKGTPVRIQSPHGPTYIYTNTKQLQPGEEAILTSSIKRDDDFLQFSSKALSRGVYYVKPIILSYSVKGSEENKVQINNYMLSF